MRGEEDVEAVGAHTPSEWQVGWVAPEGTYKHWLILEGGAITVDSENRIASLTNRRDAEANARLIAAAPEGHAVNVALVAWDTWRFGPTPETARLLREALTAIGYTGGLNASMGGIVDASRSVIAKASGR